MREGKSQARKGPLHLMRSRNRCQLLPFALGMGLAATFLFAAQASDVALSGLGYGYVSPMAMTGSKDGKAIFIACTGGHRIVRLEIGSRTLSDWVTLPQPPSGLTLSADGFRLQVTGAGPESEVLVVDVARQRLLGTIPAGHTALTPVLSPDGKTLYVCNRFNHDVSVIDLGARKELCRIPVQREPVAADITKDGRCLLVANHLHSGRAESERVAAVVSVIEVSAGKVVKELQLPNGSSLLTDLRVSPDGRFAAVTHGVASFNRAASQVARGWMNASALTLIRLDTLEARDSVLLDEPLAGAANSWGVAWSADSATLVVTHAGTHEVSIIDFPRLLAALEDTSDTPGRSPSTTALSKPPGASSKVLTFISPYEGMDPGLPFLTGARRRVKLPPGDLGPRAVIVAGQTAYTANYFSDTLTAIDLSDTNSKPESIPLSNAGARNPKSDSDVVRRGELYFHDARLCYQGWQSCSSCHPGEGRADGLNWDLLNDGIGNPKNTKSLLLAFQTPPAMWLGVRETAETAVRAGIEHVLFTKQPDDVVFALGEYIKSLKPTPSPLLLHGQLSQAAERGKKVFARAGCITCHPPPLFTDRHQYDVGTRARFDRAGDQFDTPTLIEIWRTAPYLHDGSAATIRDVLTTRNPHDRHGQTSNLSKQELDALCGYLLSL